MPLLDDDAVRVGLRGLPGWTRQDHEITKVFEFPTFPEAIAFVERVAQRAETADHHPDLDIRWRKVRAALSTHDQGGLTEKDLTMAAEIESVVTVA